MFIPKSVYNRLISEHQEVVELNRKLIYKIAELEKMVRISTSRRAAISMIDSEIERCKDNEETNKLKILKEIAIADSCYSNYLTRTEDGRLCIDVNQIPRTSEDMLSVLNNIRVGDSNDNWREDIQYT